MIKMNFNLNTQTHSRVSSNKPIQMIHPPNRHLPQVPPKINRNVEISIPDPPSKKITWGEPVWFLFHTLAHKIKENAFYSLKNELLNIIFLICTNLPCPDCANHATRYLQGINFDAIDTKDQLKDMIFNFHNSVNMRKGFPIFPREELDKKYDSAITVNIINNFYYHFEKSSHNQKMAANSFHRNRTIQRMKSWISSNVSNFSP
jgi:hypothetical protein